MLITGLGMNIGMSTFYSAPLQGFFWLWMGIGVSAALKIAPQVANHGQIATWA
jgi:hypothetical protein